MAPHGSSGHFLACAKKVDAMLKCQHHLRNWRKQGGLPKKLQKRAESLRYEVMLPRPGEILRGELAKAADFWATAIKTIGLGHLNHEFDRLAVEVAQLQRHLTSDEFHKCQSLATHWSKSRTRGKIEGGTIQYVLGFCNEVLRGSNSGAFPIASNSEQPGSPRPPVTVKIQNSNKVAPPVAKSQGAGSDGREGTTNRVPRPGRPPSPLVSDPAPIVTSNPFSALAGLACEDEKAATNVVTSFNRKTRAGKGKRGAPRSPSPSVRKTSRRSKEAEAPAIAIANLVAEQEVGRSETVETEEASVQPALPTGERGGEGEEEFLPVVSVSEGARVASSTAESGDRPLLAVLL